MCRARPSTLIPGYFESCADLAVRETERNVESEVYPGLKCQPVSRRRNTSRLAHQLLQKLECWNEDLQWFMGCWSLVCHLFHSWWVCTPVFELLYQSQYDIFDRADILENCQKLYWLNKLYLTNIKNKNPYRDIFCFHNLNCRGLLFCICTCQLAYH